MQQPHFRLKLKPILDLRHQRRGLLQARPLFIGQRLLDDGQHPVLPQDGGEGQENIILDSVQALVSQKNIIGV